MNLPTAIRYKAYDKWTPEEIAHIKENMAKSPWHATYHLEPKMGLLNDPNGFSYFDGKFHLFYQNFPFAASHGLKQWVHTTSTDLVHFEETGVELKPDTPLDSHGAYSGSAYQVDDKLFLFYTGNVRDDNWVRTPLQIGAFMNKDGKIEKIKEVLIEPASDATEHFRDPQIFKHEGNFYAIVGAQNHNKQGFIKLYRALDNNVLTWEEIGNLDFAGTGSEYMIECPNLVFVNEQPVLLYSPQGLDKAELAYDNIYPNTYKICQALDTKTAKLIDPSPIFNLDYGFEAYATQAFNMPDGTAYAVSWIGLPDVDYPTDQYDYQGAMSLVKELTIKDGKLYQNPVSAMTSLRQSQEALSNKEKTDNTYELEILIPENSQAELLLFADQDGKGFTITFDTHKGEVVIDRSQVGQQYALEFGTSRSCPIPRQACKARIFIDKSIFEIFLNDGEQVLTGRIFPTAQQSGIQVKSGQITGTYYQLKG
ncbi:sucrose-6-phosphate hydrolase [Streptococcus cuniculipharyngis]|uniref:Sucrose-6-phosphate hydrolase n=1 Tax=Streptococcus cuniculipharyngis TaxID=1562651 RepID=A0A5C5S9N3_9STRE|nr:sucrose-6-phosphate hydrolase [Streptococcus cuniculipharyngis]TWS96705.1 sucrose-6-phosphate hydrolase [Streptococcus cuniculipharyngis]